MKKILICGIIVMGALASCNSFLDIHQYSFLLEQHRQRG